jgi:hypothetical protein
MLVFPADFFYTQRAVDYYLDTETMFKKIIILCLLTLLAAACGPRGETNSLEQVFSAAKADFTKSKKAQVPAVVTKDFEFIEQSLAKIVATDFSKAEALAPDIAKALVRISRHSGYTVRPSIGELANQYLVLAERETASASVKLLVARTYSLLAQELASTAFRL